MAFSKGLRFGAFAVCVTVVGGVMLYSVMLKNAAKKLPTVSDFDMAKFGGKWFEVARMPNSSEANCLYPVNMEYNMDKMTATFSCVEKNKNLYKLEGELILDKKVEGLMTVKFKGLMSFLVSMFPGNSKVIAVGDVLEGKYQMAVVSRPFSQDAWVLSRTESASSDKEMKDMLDVLANAGFNTAKLVYPFEEAKKAGLFHDVNNAAGGMQSEDSKTGQTVHATESTGVIVKKDNIELVKPATTPEE